MYVACVFVSRTNPWFLLQITGIVRQHLRAPFQMARFLIQLSHLGLYPWAPSRPDIVRGVVFHAQSVLRKTSGGGWIRMGDFAQVCAT